MKSILDRVSKLEAVTNPPAMEEMILYVHRTQAECDEFNARHVSKNNPLPPMVCRPVAEWVEP